MITAIVTGTNTMKGELHGSNILLNGSSLDDQQMTNITSDSTSMSNLTHSFVILSNNADGSAIGQAYVSHSDAKPCDELGDLLCGI